MTPSSLPGDLTSLVRRQRQQEQLDILLGAPLEKQAWLAIGLWPGRLPKQAKTVLSKEVLQQWNTLREERQRKKKASKEERNIGRLLLSDKQRLALTQFGFHEAMLEQFDEQSRSLLGHVRSIRNEKIVSVGLVEREDDGYSLHFLPSEVANQEAQYAMARRLFCVALCRGGVILVHQRLPLMVISNGTDGDDTWKPQERLYGFQCEQGRWRAMDPKVLRMANHECGLDGTLTFGTLTMPPENDIRRPISQLWHLK